MAPTFECHRLDDEKIDVMFRIIFLLTVAVVLSSTSVGGQDTLCIGYLESVPMLMVDEDLNGPAAWLWQEIAPEVDIPYRLEEMSFSDLLEGLASGEVDFTINPITITHDRAELFDFTYPVYAAYTAIAVREPGEWTKLMDMIGNFFSYNFFRGLTILTVIILFFAFLTWSFEHKVNPHAFRPGIKGIWDGVWWSVVTMTTVGYGDKTPKSRGGKIVAVVWMFSGLLFISGFTASIASSFTVDRLAKHNETIESLKQKPVGTVAHSSTEDFLQSNFFRDVRLCENLDQGLEDLANGEIEAFFYDEPILNYRSKELDAKGLHLLPTKCNLQYLGLGFSEDRVDLKRRLEDRILEISEGIEWRLVLEEYQLSPTN